VIDRNEALRRSIAATVEEIVAAHKALGLPPDKWEVWEVEAAIARIEAQIKRRADDARDVAVEDHN
jgi:hypothetical protein